MAKKVETVESSANDKVKAALALLNKTFGDGSAMTFNNVEVKKIPAISTGSISLDLALGIGGLPLGRCCEIYGPESSGKSTICMQVCAEAQKMGYVVAYMDLENTFDPLYARNLGVDLNSLVFSQPSCIEDAFNAMTVLLKNKLCNVIIFDSIASGKTKAELSDDFEVGDNLIGVQARIMSQGLRNIAPLANEANCLCLFTNQTRQKIGVMFGCLHGETKINFDDGRSIPIGEVVKNKIQGNVYCMLPDGKITSKPIINWFDNGKIQSKNDMIMLDSENLDGNGHNTIVCTPNHKVFTSEGWVEAKDAKNLAFKYENFIGDGIAGMFIGDSCITVRSHNTGRIVLQDSANPEYVSWKLNKFKIFNFRKKVFSGVVKYISEYNSFFAIEKQKLEERNPLYMLRDNFSWLNLAIWYMDDGYFGSDDSHFRSSICIRRIKDICLQKEIVDTFNEKTGLHASWSDHYHGILLNKADTIIFQQKICKYVPECMQYKLGEQYRNKYVDFDLEIKKEYVVKFLPVTIANGISDRKFRWKNKYDIQVQDASCYFAGSTSGALVHNSPETTPGGGAMAFYASVRMRIAGKSQIKEGKGDDAIATARETEVKVVKNKVAPPFRTANFVIRFGKGISKEEEVLDYAVKFGILEKAGAWFRYNGENVAQGKEKALAWLKSNPELLENFTKRVKDFVISSFDEAESVEGDLVYNPETGEVE